MAEKCPSHINFKIMSCQLIELDNNALQENGSRVVFLGGMQSVVALRRDKSQDCVCSAQLKTENEIFFIAGVL